MTGPVLIEGDVWGVHHDGVELTIDEAREATEVAEHRGDIDTARTLLTAVQNAATLQEEGVDRFDVLAVTIGFKAESPEAEEFAAKLRGYARSDT